MMTYLKGKIPAVEATMLVYAQDGSELQFLHANKDLQVGDLVLLSAGQYVPADTKILVGEIKTKDDQDNWETFSSKMMATGGRYIVEGSAKGYVFAKAEESLWAFIQ